jgi:hypothetical protein
MTYQNNMNFSTNNQPNLATSASIDLKPLMQLAQQAGPQPPATKQPASTGAQATAPAGGVNTTAAQNLGARIGQWLDAYRTKMQQYGGGQGQPQPQPQPQQQQVGPPMNIVPQGYGYQ